MSNYQKSHSKHKYVSRPRYVAPPPVAPVAPMAPVAPVFSEAESTAACIVSGKLGMQNSTLDKVKISTSMRRINVTFRQSEAVIIFFDKPKNIWYNKPASIVAGHIIEGSAIILGVLIQDIVESQTTSAPSWAGVARDLPKVIPLDDRARERKLVETAERGDAWRDYFDRKERRRYTDDPDKLTEEQEDAANTADAEFAVWTAQEHDYLSK